MRFGTAAERLLLSENGSVTGLAVSEGGRPMTLSANRGVVLSHLLVDGDGHRFADETGYEVHDRLRALLSYLPRNPNRPRLPGWAVFDEAARPHRRDRVRPHSGRAGGGWMSPA